MLSYLINNKICYQIIYIQLKTKNQRINKQIYLNILFSSLCDTYKVLRLV